MVVVWTRVQSGPDSLGRRILCLGGGNEVRPGGGRRKRTPHSRDETRTGCHIIQQYSWSFDFLPPTLATMVNKPPQALGKLCLLCLPWVCSRTIESPRVQIFPHRKAIQTRPERANRGMRLAKRIVSNDHGRAAGLDPAGPDLGERFAL